MDREQEMSFEERLKNAADQHEHLPSPDVWMNVRNDVIQNRNSKRRAFLWIGSLAAAFLLGVLASEYILNPHQNVNVYSANQNSPKTSAADHSSSHNSVIGNPAESSPNPIHTENNHAGKNVTTSAQEKTSASKEAIISLKNHPTPNPVSGNAEATVTSTNSPSSSAFQTGSNEDQSMAGSFTQNHTDHSGLISAETAHSEMEPVAAGNPNQSIKSLPEKVSILSSQFADKISYRTTGSSLTILPQKSAKPFYATIEADFIPLANHISNSFPNTSYFVTKSEDTVTFSKKPEKSSFTSYGFSSGLNFYYNFPHVTFIGGGLHYTKTSSQLEFPASGQYVFDGPYVYTDSVATSSGFVHTDSIPTNAVGNSLPPELKTGNEWLDFSFLFGINLFPQSKNHLRLSTGIAYSRLLSSVHTSVSSQTIQELYASSGNTSESSLLKRNQVQLFLQAKYLRELSEHFSLAAGFELHGYPMNLQNSDNISQRQLWIGLNLGVDYTFAARSKERD